MATCGFVVDLARRLHKERGRRPTVVVDEIGVGAGVVDRLRELGEFDVRGFNSSGRPARPHEHPNKRSEIWFRAAEVLPLLDLDPGDEDLAADLLAPTFSFASDGGRVVEPKASTRKRLRRSPDRADAVLLTLAVDPPVAPGRVRKRRGVYWVKGSVDEALVQIGGALGGEVRSGAGAPRIPVTGEASLDERLVQLGVPVADTVADRYGAGLLGRVVEHVGAPHPFLAAGNDTPRGAKVTKAPPVVERFQAGSDNGTVWNGPEDSR